MPSISNELKFSTLSQIVEPFNVILIPESLWLTAILSIMTLLNSLSNLVILCESSHEIINNSRKVVVIKFYSFTFYSVLNLSINDLGL